MDKHYITLNKKYREGKHSESGKWVKKKDVRLKRGLLLAKDTWDTVVRKKGGQSGNEMTLP